MEPVTVATLKTFEALKSVPDEQLQWLIESCEEVILPEGSVFIKPDVPIAGPHFIIDGEFIAFVMQNGSKRELGTFGAGHITGYLPFSRGKMASVYMKARHEVRLLTFPTERIREMIRDQFELTQALVHVMTSRVREFTAFQQQNEKMMALGKLSAGLTHELNNPASAIVRDSISLREHLRLEPETFKKMIAIKMDNTQVDAVNDELFRVLDETDRPRLTLKEKTKREEELGDWFDALDIEDSYEMAENFVDFNFKVADLENFKKHIPDAFLSPVFGWINTLLVTEKMVEDIQESSRRIAELVKSVKTFTHMDRGADKQYADIHIGIRNTLTMLGYRKKKGNVTLVEDFDLNLPPVKALIGELNQVWTNLIDNAFDAMDQNGKGILTIKTERDREFVQVSIIDDGPGIPEDIRSRVFDPFFTTKEMGKGTGMGLEVVQRIVNQHKGSIKVKSVPGHTEFIVCFPING
ncbi:sensor histidine kinase [Mucilaginibacter sp. OK098]|uniref:sensor histidine kinase n=1 Tax=Mucilaginibacter sp. OK098 TaxID=1855297 RepID=UPI00091F31EC|nr:ATP-binding protein [Mucilaginibacter sp. OK098]SHN31381.1 Histidine kinase-, DNA gyrase B-, and HSP90-like ATPase [Mucilaginibacter sp. OK098]